jgi:hypothetical protein
MCVLFVLWCKKCKFVLDLYFAGILCFFNLLGFLGCPGFLGSLGFLENCESKGCQQSTNRIQIQQNMKVHAYLGTIMCIFCTICTLVQKMQICIRFVHCWLVRELVFSRFLVLVNSPLVVELVASLSSSIWFWSGPIPFDWLVDALCICIKARCLQQARGLVGKLLQVLSCEMLVGTDPSNVVQRPKRA